MKNLNLEIEGFGLINEAKIEISKINVVGGVNASGKSTASKILYCFLKAMSLNRQEYVLSTILLSLNKFINIMEAPKRDVEFNNISNEKFTMDDNFEDILKAYVYAKDTYDRLGASYFETPIDELMIDLVDEIESLFPVLIDKENQYYSSIVRSLFSEEWLLDFEGRSKIYNELFNCSVSYVFTEINGFRYERDSELKFQDISYDDFDRSFIYSTEGSFNFLNDVFYIDSISTFDLYYYLSQGIKGHLKHLLADIDKEEGLNLNFGLEDGKVIDKRTESKLKLSEDIIQLMDSINERISDIIGGKVNKKSEIYYNGKGFGKEYFYFQPISSNDSYKLNISSGIQQITLIQILLANYKLQPGSFLIIDEPEVNLHPDWQFKLAEILVLLAKDLNIIVYLNSHSPFFIEAIDAFTEFYDMQDDINYYLTEESEVEGKYNFTKIESDELYKIYENLGNAYDLINQLRLRKRFEQ